MAFDADLADRIRELLARERGVDEKYMFGGLAFLLGGHMAVAVSGKGGLLARIAADEADDLLQQAHVEPMVMAGRPTKGWVRVSADGIATERQLRVWVDRSVAYVKSLPPK